MGAGLTQHGYKKIQFTLIFSVSLRQLFGNYKTLVLFMKSSKLFASRSEKLSGLVDRYLTNPMNFPKENMQLSCIDSVHKLHPVQYGTKQVTKEWLIEACLRQNKFVQEFPFQSLDYDQSYAHYAEFLYMCFKAPKAISIPNKLADFMWHSHMQDNQGYKKDCRKMLKRVLDHIDDFTPEQLFEHSKKTQEVEKQYLEFAEQHIDPPYRLSGCGSS